MCSVVVCAVLPMCSVALRVPVLPVCCVAVCAVLPMCYAVVRFGLPLCYMALCAVLPVCCVAVSAVLPVYCVVVCAVLLVCCAACIVTVGTLMHSPPHFVAGPHFAAVNSNNEIIVTDFHNHSVKVQSARLLLALNCFCRESGLVGNNTQHWYRLSELGGQSQGSDFRFSGKVFTWPFILGRVGRE